MKAFACTVLLVVLTASACSSGDDTAATASNTGTPEAFCPRLVDFAVESALAGAAVDASAGPQVVSGPEFARTRELLGELIQAAPPRVRELVEAASFEPDKGEVADPEAANAMWTAIADLRGSCTSEQSPACASGLAAIGRGTTPEAFSDGAIASLTQTCSAPPYLAGTDECDTLALAFLQDGGDTELPIIEHFAERCG